MNRSGGWNADVGDPKLRAMARMLKQWFPSPRRTLVVGCGDGTEAALLQELLGGTIVGVDILGEFDRDAMGQVELVAADAGELPFDVGSFDLVFSFHMLEHVSLPSRAIAEMRRVTSVGGGLWLGTPNRSRLMGYLGSRDASFREKVAWNVGDWRTRATGRFRNELGAHAGFTIDELVNMLHPHFRVVRDATSAYYAAVYEGHPRALAAINRTRLGRFVYPAVYVVGKP